MCVCDYKFFFVFSSFLLVCWNGVVVALLILVFIMCVCVCELACVSDGFNHFHQWLLYGYSLKIAMHVYFSWGFCVCVCLATFMDSNCFVCIRIHSADKYLWTVHVAQLL